MEAWIATENALECVLEAVRGESILIVADDVNKSIGDAFVKGAINLGLWTRLVLLDTTGDKPRRTVPDHLKEAILGGLGKKPDIFINLLRGGAEETPFRIKIIKLETRIKNSRLGHCPGITLDMMTEGALALTKEEHLDMQNLAERLILSLSGAISVNVTSPKGTELSLNVKGREFFTDTKIDWKKLKWMNLPTGEVIVGPVETSLNGTLVCDVAIGGIGPIDNPVTIEVKDGRATSIRGEDRQAIAIVKEAQETDDWAKYVGEFAFGINPKARLVKEFLEAEKLNNTVHFAFGHNLDFPGGKNASANHMDFLISKPSVKIYFEDGTEKMVMKEGEYIQ